MSAIEIILYLILGLLAVFAEVLIMGFCYAIGYRNCAREALKQMEELENK